MTSLLKEFFPRNKKKLVEELLDARIGKIVKKGTDMTTTDLYNLCLLNKERDENEKRDDEP